MSAFKILLVEDEKKIAETLSQGLMEHQYLIDIAADGVVGKQLFIANKYDLIILDINLPKLNGLELCKFIRHFNDRILIMMLTAMTEMDEKLAGFHSGADDYLVKPFDFKELLARMGALLKRLHRYIPEGNVLKAADLVLHLDSKEATRDGKLIPLTAKEFQLLEYFILNKNRLVSRADIAVAVWDIDFDTRTNVIDVYVNFLRNKIEKGFPSKLIHTYVGQGYILKDTL